MNYYSSPPSNYSLGFEGLCQSCGKYIGSYAVYYSNVCEDCEAALTEAAQQSKALVYRFGAYAKRKRDIRLY
jgi:predicted amidophosphoribosyltransferase